MEHGVRMNRPRPAELEPGDRRSEPVAEPRPSSHRWLWLPALLLGAIIAYWALARERGGAESSAARAAARAIPVAVAPARSGRMPVVLDGLGTVTAFNTVTVRSRVDGQLVQIGFQEGQFVEKGDLIAQIDPRPFEAELAQAEGTLVRDEAQLRDARVNLERYRDLLARSFISKQQYDDQAALVGQFEGAVKVDQGAIASAKLQLLYCRITAPISGRVGLRLVDVGNIVHAADPSGLAVITQVQPITVLFTIPEDRLPDVMRRLQAGKSLEVEAYDRSGRTKIADGKLATTDNQIDPATGTFKLKAVFENQDHALFPNQFVNVRLLLEVRPDATIVPTAAVQRGPKGPFVYVVKADQTVEARPVTIGLTEGSGTSIDSGLSPGEVAVVDGADKLRPGAAVEVRKSEIPAPAPHA
jgi:multidrug efflux system membrane fusion protein